ncbi:MAG: hypothetical protein KAT93_07930 [Desulfuromonadales bacterium]|nr:hypothetical protein [Desulfuromonadales bacterium]
MITKNWILPLTTLTLATLSSVTVLAAVPTAVHDPHRLADTDEFQKTIEARCTICHARDKADDANRAREELDALLQRMIERGAILSDKDKNVLGTFWGTPLKKDK